MSLRVKINMLVTLLMLIFIGSTTAIQLQDTKRASGASDEEGSESKDDNAETGGDAGDNVEAEDAIPSAASFVPEALQSSGVPGAAQLSSHPYPS